MTQNFPSGLSVVPGQVFNSNNLRDSMAGSRLEVRETGFDASGSFVLFDLVGVTMIGNTETRTSLTQKIYTIIPPLHQSVTVEYDILIESPLLIFDTVSSSLIATVTDYGPLPFKLTCSASTSWFGTDISYSWTNFTGADFLNYDLTATLASGDDILTHGDGSLLLYAGGGNDTIFAALGFSYPDSGDTIFGEAGNDRIYYQIEEDQISGHFIDGGEGDDIIRAAGGAGDIGAVGQSTVVGGAGDDEIEGVGNWTFLEEDESGDDLYTATYWNNSILDYSLLAGGIDIAGDPNGWGTVTAPDGSVDTFLGFSRIVATDYADYAVVPIAGLILDLRAGDDIADYSLYGSWNGFKAYGGAGNDTILGSFGDDFFDGGLDDDTITGAAGNDTLHGVGGHDSLAGGDGHDSLIGGLGDDVLNGGAGNDVLNGGDNTGVGDTASYAGASAGVRVNLTILTQQNTVGSDFDTLMEIENLIGSDHDDTLIGDAGSNLFVGGLGNDVLTGGAHSDIGDTVSYFNATASVAVSLAVSARQNTRSAGFDTLSGFENLIGSGFNDTLTGDGFANKIIGADGADNIRGGAGNDVLDGGALNDRLDGGIGADTMIGGSGNDTYTVDNVGDVVDETNGAGGNAGGTDLVSASISFALTGLAGFVENLTLTGSAALNGTGNDLANKITGNSGANVLSGGGGKDSLIGNAGQDRLIGGAGNDALNGGLDADIFVFERAGLANGVDKIADFVSGLDKLEVQASDYLGLSVAGLTAAQLTFGTVAVGAGAQFVYNSARGQLAWDADGAGGAASTQIATLKIGAILTASDFLIV